MWTKRLLLPQILSGRAVLLFCACLIVAVPAGFAQDAAPAPQATAKADDPAPKSPEFEVASIKPYKQEGEGIRMMTRYTPDAYIGEGLSLHFLIRGAYGVEDNQIIGGDKWIESDQYAINAKMDEPTIEALKKLSPDQGMEFREKMMQALLMDRFKLQVHRESRELPVYALVIAKGGSKLQEAKEGDTYANGIKGPDGKSRGGMMRMGPGELTCQAIPIKSLVTILSDRSGRHVVDKTNLTGKYDFTLKWQDGDASTDGGAPSGGDAAGPSLFTAVQEQLGLKLEAQKASVEVLVIDHAEKPTTD